LFIIFVGLSAQCKIFILALMFLTHLTLYPQLSLSYISHFLCGPFRNYGYRFHSISNGSKFNPPGFCRSKHRNFSANDKYISGVCTRKILKWLHHYQRNNMNEGSGSCYIPVDFVARYPSQQWLGSKIYKGLVLHMQITSEESRYPTLVLTHKDHNRYVPKQQDTKNLK